MALTHPARTTDTVLRSYVVLAIADAVLAGRTQAGARRARRVTKPLLMALLGVGTRARTAGRRDRLAAATTAAQVFSWGGDVALLGRRERAFLAGVGSFFLAHVSYIAGFASARDPRARLSDTGPKAAGAVLLVLAPVMATAAGRKDPQMRLPIAAYAAILASMFGASTMLDEALGAPARRRIVAGTSLFLLSDGLIGIQRFLRATPSPPLETAVMLTYTAGQWLIADGVAAAGRND